MTSAKTVPTVEERTYTEADLVPDSGDPVLLA